MCFNLHFFVYLPDGRIIFFKTMIKCICILHRGFVMKKNKQYKLTAIILLILSALSINSVFADPSATLDTPAKENSVQIPAASAICVDPVKVVDSPNFYLNKTITFDADFISFTSLGLDYNPALRKSNDYIGILIQRSDVKDHVIPLSEMKIFLNRKEAEKHVDLEQGDKIQITGTVFSTALGDPWLDIKTFKVIEKKNKDNKENK